MPNAGSATITADVGSWTRLVSSDLLRAATVLWLGSRVVSVLDSGVQIAAATLSGNSLRQTVHAHRASVHQAA